MDSIPCFLCAHQQSHHFLLWCYLSAHAFAQPPDTSPFFLSCQRRHNARSQSLHLIPLLSA